MTEQEIAAQFATEVPSLVQPGERVLVIIPDTTRSAPMPMLIALLLPLLKACGAQVRILVALGTHPPLPHDLLYQHVGLDPATSDTPVLNHAWNSPGQLVSVGTLTAEEVHDLSAGLMAQTVDLRVNRELVQADRVLILHPVFPHELVGMSGGAKYLFPGISGPELIEIIHWLGALRGSNATIGLIDTPSRRVLNAAADRMPVPIHSLAFVYHQHTVVAMEIGPLTEAWQRAAEVAQAVHITRKPRPYSRVLACCPPMYPDLWTGGKCVYKVEPIVADGGELIVYAPHVTCFSQTHQATIKALGYHVRPYFQAHAPSFDHLPKAVMAYTVIVKGDGTYIDGVEHPRIHVFFASQISQAECEAANIGYIDPASIDLDAWRNREDEGTLLVEHAGERLYRLASEEHPCKQS